MNLKTLPEQLYMYPVREPQSNSLSTIEPGTLILTTQYHHRHCMLQILCYHENKYYYDIIDITSCRNLAENRHSR